MCGFEDLSEESLSLPCPRKVSFVWCHSWICNFPVFPVWERSVFSDVLKHFDSGGSWTNCCLQDSRVLVACRASVWLIGRWRRVLFWAYVCNCRSDERFWRDQFEMEMTGKADDGIWADVVAAGFRNITGWVVFLWNTRLYSMVVLVQFLYIFLGAYFEDQQARTIQEGCFPCSGPSGQHKKVDTFFTNRTSC